MNQTARFESLNWPGIARELDTEGYAILPALLTTKECAALTTLYAEDERFRSRVVMARHGYGRGEYKYFDYPLPRLVSDLRATFYPPLCGIANKWNETMGFETRFPSTFDTFTQQCHAAGQTRPTPLLLKYEADDYNCLHQDLYGEMVFPLQMAFLLSSPGHDFTGGEFIMTEQRPRMQSRGMVVLLQQGDAVVFPVRQRPVQGTHRQYRVNMRHGVSKIRSGQRHTLGVIFHDAQ